MFYDFWFLLILAVLAFPVLSIVAFVMALRRGADIRRLQDRVGLLEARLAASPPPLAGQVAPATEAAPPPIREPLAEPAPAPEPAAAAPSLTPPPPSTVQAPAAPRPGLEEAIGTRWAVWVGGLALALGGVFLVRYSIEEGLLGPGLRLVLGGLFAVALIAAGEWTRRQENRAGVAGIPAAHIPSILTAAGTSTAYATVYAAYALYGFLPSPVAFVALGAVALATLAAALLHGWPLAALGTLAAYVTPLLVASEAPAWWSLALYLMVVTAAAYGLARLRFWRWLVVATLVFSLGWACFLIVIGEVATPPANAVYVLAAATAFSLLIAANVWLGPTMRPGFVDRLTSLGLIAHALVLGAIVVDGNHETLLLVVFAVLLVAILAMAWKSDAASGAVPGAAIVAALVVGEWALEPILSTTLGLPGPMTGAQPDLPLVATGAPMLFAAGAGGLFLVSGLAAQLRAGRSWPAILWAGGAVLAPLAILALLYGRIAGFERSIPFAGVALLLAALYLTAVEMLTARGARMSGLGVIATGGLAALALALTMVFDKGYLTVSLALLALAAAWVSTQRPLPLLRWVAAIAALAVVARLVWDPRVVGTDVGTTPIFNWLLYGYGVPALAFWAAGWLMRRTRDDTPVRIVESLAILFTVLTVTLQIRHIVNDGDMLAPVTGLLEIGLNVSALLAIAIGLEWVRQRSGSVIHRAGAALLTALAIAGGLFGGLFDSNPWWTGEPVPGLIFNAILLGYGIPAVLAAILAWVIAGTRADWYRWIVAGFALLMGLAWITLQVRRIFQGPMMDGDDPFGAELYAYSAAWLMTGLVLLIGGLLLRSQPARLASAAIIVLAVAKVFLIDMSDLTGVWRALSFIGLGLVLVGIGLLYQRLLFGARSAGPPSPT
jgi:uncharacterized membrane protein